MGFSGWSNAIVRVVAQLWSGLVMGPVGGGKEPDEIDRWDRRRMEFSLCRLVGLSGVIDIWAANNVVKKDAGGERGILDCRVCIDCEDPDRSFERDHMK